MERRFSSLRSEVGSSILFGAHESFRCSTCGERVEKPLLAMLSSGCEAEEYYACPKCLSRVCSVERERSVEAYGPDEEKKESLKMKVEKKIEEIVTCSHHLGYLKKRPKNSPIPEECFTCSKMIDCMSF